MAASLFINIQSVCIFVKMFKEGLAYEKEFPINWCPSCKTGLANEEVVGGKCESCGAEVTKKNLRQWMLRITKYADRLLNDLDKLDWPEKVKKMQTDWIGKSYGDSSTAMVDSVSLSIPPSFLAISADATKEEALEAGKAAIADKLTGNVIKEIYVPKKIKNIVMK